MPRASTSNTSTARGSTTGTTKAGATTGGGSERLTRRISRALALEFAVARAGDRAAWLLAAPLRAVRTDTGKRVVVVAAAVLALAATVRALHASAELPTSLPDTPLAATSPADPAADAAADPAEDPATQGDGAGEPPAATVPPNKPVKPTPEEAAVAFYAAELDLPADRVRALQRQRINDNSVNVLVLAERGAEDLPTRLIQVNRTQSGWRVP